jgi:hypothetical protein
MSTCAGACQAIWFDQYESAQLTPSAVIDLFRRIHDHRDDARTAACGSSALPSVPRERWSSRTIDSDTTRCVITAVPTAMDA